MCFVLCGRFLRFCIAIGFSSLLLLGFAPSLLAQTAAVQSTRDDEVQQLKGLVLQLQSRVERLEKERSQGAPISFNGTGVSSPAAAQAQQSTSDQAMSSPSPEDLTSEDRSLLDYLRGTTINFAVDAYYGYNFNHPVGRVDALRAYDVLSNNISLNQANVIFERAPDLETGRRYGARLDLQFGQATDTLQGNPANEPRPQIYRNILQAYGTYILPVGNGISLDVG